MTLLVGILLTLTEKEKTKLILANILSSSLVAILAILEYFHGGSVLFAQGGVFSWESLRAISTFGNPNYVAGYLLMSLPFLTHVRNIERSLYFVIIGAGIVVTGSYIGISLLLLYCIYRLLRMRLSIQKSLIFLSGICVLGGVIAYQFVTPDKLLSLKSRFVILSELWTVMVQYPLSFIIGFGPESIIAYFDGARSEIINSYFPPSSAIDSSHNIVFDFLFQYGIIPIIGVCFYLKKYWKKIRVGGQEGIILGILFFSLNVTVTVHMTLLLLYGLLYHEKKD